MKEFDKELIESCRRYLSELKRRSTILEKEKAELKEAEAQKKVRREYWRKVLYGSREQYLSLIVPGESRLNSL